MSDDKVTWSAWDLNAHHLQAAVNLFPDLAFPVSGDDLASIQTKKQERQQ